jgi:hypothetical protein
MLLISAMVENELEESNFVAHKRGIHANIRFAFGVMTQLPLRFQGWLRGLQLLLLILCSSNNDTNS